VLRCFQKEEPRETSMRFTLLREREDRCARGDVEACDFFRPGYFELDELVHEVRSIVPSV
jgi:hypothetical protein